MRIIIPIKYDTVSVMVYAGTCMQGFCRQSVAAGDVLLLYP